MGDQPSQNLDGALDERIFSLELLRCLITDRLRLPQVSPHQAPHQGPGMLYNLETSEFEDENLRMRWRRWCSRNGFGSGSSSSLWAELPVPMVTVVLLITVEVTVSGPLSMMIVTISFQSQMRENMVYFGVHTDCAYEFIDMCNTCFGYDTVTSTVIRITTVTTGTGSSARLLPLPLPKPFLEHHLLQRMCRFII
eukprot:330891-Prorocentrum_minimum.AAC.1